MSEEEVKVSFKMTKPEKNDFFKACKAEGFYASQILRMLAKEYTEKIFKKKGKK